MRYNQNNDVVHVEVQPLTDALKACYGKSYFLEEHKALELQREGVVGIIDKEYLQQSDFFTDLQQQQTAITSKRDFMKTKRKLRIAWVQDQSNLGGAELSNLCVVKVGVDLGFDIVLVTPNKFNKNTLNGCDLVILNNIFEFSSEQFTTLFDTIFFSAKPFIKYDHDLRELKRMNITRKVFEHSLFNTFISPAHYQAYEKVYGPRLKECSVILPLAIDTKVFKHDSSVERKPNTAIIPTFVKGQQEHIKYIRDNPDVKFTVLRTSWRFAEKNVSKIGTATIERMATLYRQHEFMVHLPTDRGAGERVFFEAILCGCKPVVNDNVSHQSWEGYAPHDGTLYGLSEWLNEAPYKFWKAVEEHARHCCLL